MSTTIRQLQKAKQASQEIQRLSESKINAVLRSAAKEILKNKKEILSANAKDCRRMNQTDSRYARLLLTTKKIDDIASALINVSKLKSPVNKILESRTVPSGLFLQKVSVPLGVVGVIYEARPNVTPDIFSLCFKSGNACVLKGGSEAYQSHQVFVEIIKKVLRKNKVTADCVQLLPADRTAVGELLKARGLVDVVIPRGGQGLINYVRENAKVPIIETGAGVVHTYVDVGADINMASRIIENAKTNRPAVCNALDTLLAHQNNIKRLGALVSLLQKHGVELYCDSQSYRALAGLYNQKKLFRARANDFGREFLSLKMAVKVVKSLDAAISHIGKYGSGHSEAIITKDKLAMQKFFNEVDAAAVYANAPTVFTDGGEFGLGAEVGISTQKLHARGPMGLAALTTYKWVVRGNGQVRK